MCKTNLNEGHAGMFNSKSVQPILLNDSSNSAKYKNGVWQNRIASKGLQMVSPTETTFTKLGYISLTGKWQSFVNSHQTSWKVLRPKSKEQDRNVQLLNGYMNHEILINSQGSWEDIEYLYLSQWCVTIQSILEITCIIYAYVCKDIFIHPFSGYSTAICSHLNVH